MSSVFVYSQWFIHPDGADGAVCMCQALLLTEVMGCFTNQTTCMASERPPPLLLLLIMMMMMMCLHQEIKLIILPELLKLNS